MRDCRDEIADELCATIISNDLHGANLRNAVFMVLNKYEITSRSTELVPLDQESNDALLRRFLIAKKVSGRTDRTVQYYGITIRKVLDAIGKNVPDITPDDIRIYMARRQLKDHVTQTTTSSEIRALSSFFTWVHNEEIITKNPMARVDKVKAEKKAKKAFTDLEVERIRSAAKDERQKCMIELLFSTGCRAMELIQIKRTEIDGDRILVHGKGNKDRYVYLNARAKVALDAYLRERKDDSIWLFPMMDVKNNAERIRIFRGTKRGEAHNWWKNPKYVSLNDHMIRETLEENVRRIGREIGIEECHPHKFRRTCATMALKHGMPIEKVSHMLGHEQLDTTKIYLDQTEDEMAEAHRKYVT